MSGEASANVKVFIGLVLGFVIGAGCRWLDLPAPAPGVLPGALLVVAMTLGYIGVDKFVQREAKNKHLCGGPSGEAAPK